jgi:hypothetical protein
MIASKKKPKEKKHTKQDLAEYLKMQDSPIYFIGVMWKLKPQPVKEEYVSLVALLVETGKLDEIRGEYFVAKNKDECVRERYFSWQQWVILLAVERGIAKKAPDRISVRSGHGCGKSATVSWLLLWYLYCHYLAQVNCTAPGQSQMYDVLWKEVSIWLNRMPRGVQSRFEWQAQYIRIKDHPEAWFARARTARKDSPEALAGMHGEYILALVDEASGVDDAIFNTMEGSLTDHKPTIIMISNPTRLIGYFYESQKGKDVKNWQVLRFSSEESPLVDWDYVSRIVEKHGKESDEYRIRVLGEFPREDMVDQQGYVPLLSRKDIIQIPVSDIEDGSPFVGRLRLGLDPAGEGKNNTSWVARDAFRAKIVLREEISNAKKIAQRTVGLCERLGIAAEDVSVDMFGIGADVVRELYLFGFYVKGVMVGDPCDDSEDQERFLNKRACYYFRARKWIKSGGELESHSAWEDQLTSVRYRRSSGRQRIQIMPKKEARKKGYHSPDDADALSLTFSDDTEDYGKVETVTPGQMSLLEQSGQTNQPETVFYGNQGMDRHSAI